MVLRELKGPVLYRPDEPVKSFEFLGHYNPLSTIGECKYPIFVNPIVMIDGRIATTYINRKEGGFEAYWVRKDLRFERYDNGKNGDLLNFNPKKHVLFAFSKKNVVAFNIDHEKDFYRQILEDGSLPEGSEFLRSELAFATEDKELVIKAVRDCLSLLIRESSSIETVRNFYQSEIDSIRGQGLSDIADELNKIDMVTDILIQQGN